MNKIKTIIIGGGAACRSLLELHRLGRLKDLALDIVCVVDPLPDAPGMLTARESGIETRTHTGGLFSLPGLEMVVELVGSDAFLAELKKALPPNLRLLDHVMARVFHDIEDVTDQLQAQLTARTAMQTQLSEEHLGLQLIFDSLPDAVVVVDKDKQVEWFNARLHEFTGLNSMDLFPGGLFEDPFCQGHNPEDPEHECSLNDVIRSGQARQLIYMGTHKDWSHSYFRIIYTPIFNEEGGLEYVVETARPIDELVVRAREVQESELRFRHFVENALDMITMKDREGRYVMINERAADMVGMSPMDFIDRTDHEIFEPKLAQLIINKDRAVLASRSAMRSDETMIFKGAKHYLDTVRFPVFDYKGDLVGLCGISRDVTRQKRLERAFLQSEKMAAIGKIAASVAHEINNPLTGILTFAEEMRADIYSATPQSPLLDDLAVVIREAMRCREIVSNLLDYARLSVTKRSLTSLNRVIEHSLALVRRRDDFKKIELKLQLDPDLPRASMDPSQIQQVVLNLVLNAAEAMELSGRITVTTQSSLDGSMVQIWVRDQGPGIRRRLMSRIFEPFVSTKAEKGNGLGLSVVQTIVDQHGGAIRVNNAPGGGAEFCIDLPVEGVD